MSKSFLAIKGGASWRRGAGPRRWQRCAPWVSYYRQHGNEGARSQRSVAVYADLASSLREQRKRLRAELPKNARIDPGEKISCAQKADVNLGWRHNLRGRARLHLLRQPRAHQAGVAMDRSRGALGDKDA